MGRSNGTPDLKSIKARVADSKMTEQGIWDSAGMDSEYRHSLALERIEARRTLWEKDAPALLAEVEKLRSRVADLEYPRPELRGFARVMEDRLRTNDHEQGWENEAYDGLLWKLTAATEDLEQALTTSYLFASRNAESPPPDMLGEAAKEAADVANYAMMAWHLFALSRAQREALELEGKERCDSWDGCDQEPDLDQVDAAMFGEIHCTECDETLSDCACRDLCDEAVPCG